MENDTVYDVKIGTNTRKGMFQCHKQMCVRSKNTMDEIHKYYESKYQGFYVVTKEAETVDITCETSLLKKHNHHKTLANKQIFSLEKWVSAGLYTDWSNLIKTRDELEDKMKKEICNKLEQRIEVEEVSEVVFANETFSCMIEIEGDLWQV